MRKYLTESLSNCYISIKAFTIECYEQIQDWLFACWEERTLIAIKAAIATIVTFLVKVITNTHVIVLIAFMGLVFLDLITKQIALGGKYAAKLKGVDVSELHTIDKIRGIIPALNAEEICSKFMRKGFADKMGMYLAVVCGAFFADVVIVNTPNHFILNLAYSYLGVVELVSILENLRDGGNRKIALLVKAMEDKIMQNIK